MAEDFPPLDTLYILKLQMESFERKCDEAMEFQKTVLNTQHSQARERGISLFEMTTPGIQPSFDSGHILQYPFQDMSILRPEPPGYDDFVQPTDRLTELEELIRKFVEASEEKLSAKDELIRNQQASLEKLEGKLEQVVKIFYDTPTTSSLSDKELATSEDKVQAVILRSGKQLEENTKPLKAPTVELSKDKKKEVEEKETPPVKEFTPKLPYPSRLKKYQDDAQYGKFLDLLK